MCIDGCSTPSHQKRVSFFDPSYSHSMHAHVFDGTGFGLPLGSLSALVQSRRVAARHVGRRRRRHVVGRDICEIVAGDVGEREIIAAGGAVGVVRRAETTAGEQGCNRDEANHFCMLMHATRQRELRAIT
ncbi:MAG: hypothetical protein LC659_11180 [Myxococcales bacterium]|nr:hypothetical protein [Myxococcales bacterium]